MEQTSRCWTCNKIKPDHEVLACANKHCDARDVLKRSPPPATPKQQIRVGELRLYPGGPIVDAIV